MLYNSNRLSVGHKQVITGTRPCLPQMHDHGTRPGVSQITLYLRSCIKSMWHNTSVCSIIIVAYNKTISFTLFIIYINLSWFCSFLSLFFYDLPNTFSIILNPNPSLILKNVPIMANHLATFWLETLFFHIYKVVGDFRIIIFLQVVLSPKH